MGENSSPASEKDLLAAAVKRRGWIQVTPGGVPPIGHELVAPAIKKPLSNRQQLNVNPQLGLYAAK